MMNRALFPVPTLAAAARLFLVTFLFASLLAVPVSAQAIRLHSGELLVGKVEDVHDEGLTFRRHDTGGTLQLRWGQLSRQSALKLKQLSGLSVDDSSDVFVTADVLTFEAAGRRDTIVGKIVEQTADQIIVQRRGSRMPIPRSKIKGRSTKEVPVLEILTEEQFYYEKLTEIAPGDDADKHVLLADFLARVRAYDLAKQHLEQAQTLGGGSQPTLLEGKLRRLAKFKSAQDERELLDQIDVCRARRQFSRGRELIAEYDERFPKGKLKSEFEQTKERFTKARDRAMVAKVTELFYKSIRSVADRKANESGLSYEGARSYTESQMGRDVRERVIKALDLEAAEVDKFWEQRFDYPKVPRALRYPYGIGSWTLGKDKILKDTEQSKGSGKQEPKSADERKMENLARRIREAQQRAQRALAASGRAESREATPEDWWDDATPEERKVWVQAYYVENSGDLKVDNAYVNPCFTCTGEGFLRVLGSNGKEQKNQCPTCHGTQFKRVVRAK